MSLLSALLLVCSSADDTTARSIVAVSTAHAVSPALSLAIGVIESGVKGRNPMGVRPCYHGRNNGRFDQTACITIGVVSLRNRLTACKGDEVCAARKYNASKNQHAYAAKAVRIARFLRAKEK